MTGCVLREFRPDDLPALKQLTVESFAGVTLEQNVEAKLGLLAGHDWRWRKARHIDEDVEANPNGIFVAEAEDAVAVCLVGYITTRIDPAAGKGRIPNLAVAENWRGRGLGAALIERALDYFRALGLEYAVIETMAQNEIGNGLYRAAGFVEVARQIHFARRL